MNKAKMTSKIFCTFILALILTTVSAENIVKYSSISTDSADSRYPVCNLSDGKVGKAKSWLSLSKKREHWIQLSWHNTATINSVEIVFPKAGRSTPQSFSLQTKTGENWETIAKCKQLGDKAQKYIFNLTSPLKTKTVRLYISEPSIAAYKAVDKSKLKYWQCRCMISEIIIQGQVATPEPSVLLYDFETPQDLNEWNLENKPYDKLYLSQDFSTYGKNSLVYETPCWHEGLNEYPIFKNTKLKTNDWTYYSKLLVDVINPTAHQEMLKFHLLVPEKSFGVPITVPPYSLVRFTLDLHKGRFAKTDMSHMKGILFYTARPDADYKFYIDNIRLLAKDVEPPPLASKLVEKIIKSFAIPSYNQTKQQLDLCLKSAEKYNNELSSWGIKQLKAFEKDLYQCEQKINNIKQQDLAKISDIRNRLEMIANRSHRVISILEFRKKWKQLSGNDDYAIGFTSSMNKVLPFDMPINVDVNNTVSISAAKFEKESFQVVIGAFKHDLKNVNVKLDDLKSNDNKVLSSDNLEVCAVGYVKTTKPIYPMPYVGWWPDTLLKKPDGIDIARNSTMSIWVRLRTPADQASGIYTGKFKVTAGNKELGEFNLKIKIHNFKVPTLSPIPLAIPSIYPWTMKHFSNKEWSQIKNNIAGTLADYYLNQNWIYERFVKRKLDFDIIRRQEKEDRLSSFSLYYIVASALKKQVKKYGYEQAINKIIEQIRPRYEQAEKLNLLKQSFIWGFDEISKKEDYELMAKAFTDMKKHFPGAATLSTAYGILYLGHKFKINLDKALDVYVPRIHYYNLEQAENIRKKHKKVAWYICNTPWEPYPNFFTDYQPINTRIIMGFMSAKLRVEGFLYYSSMRRGKEKSSKPVDEIFSDWPTKTMYGSNGCGHWFYPGKNGTVIPSFRAENFRDGLEYLAYWQILKKLVHQMSLKRNLNLSEKQWLVKSELITKIPVSVVKGKTVFTKNPATLYKYRDDLAKLIESCPIAAPLPEPQYFSTPTPSYLLD